MKRRFVIGVDGLTKDQENEFRQYLGKHGAWWHWIANVWLLATDDENITAQKIINQITKSNVEARALVMEFPEDIDWVGVGRENTQGKNMFNWLSKSWGKDQ